MKKMIFRGAWFVLGLIPISCVPSTPGSRIEQRRDLFESQSEKNKELIRKGELGKGMTKDAVVLAWGRPDEQVAGFRKGNTMERWDYLGTRPVMTSGAFGGWNSGYYGPYRYSGIGGGIGPEVTHLPYVRGMVWFVDGKVDEWETRR